jgi:uncharacterized membrane protein YjjB (DUF3815 family)
MSKFMALDRLALHVSSGRVQDIQEARKRVRDIVSADNVFRSPLYTVFTYVAYASVAPVLMNGTWGEIVASMVGSIIVALIAIARSKFKTVDKLGNTFSTLIGGLIAMLCRFLLFPLGVHVDVLMVALCSNIMNMPGLAITIALTELNAGHFMSGTMRSVAVVVRIIEFGLGLLVAEKIDLALETNFRDRYQLDQITRVEIAVWIKFLLMPIYIAVVIFAFRVPRYISAYLFITIASVIAFFGNIYLQMFLGVEVGAIITSFLIGMIGNIYSFISRRPSNVVTVCAVVFLVPGYLSAISIGKLLHQELKSANNAVFDTIMMAVSLVGGLTVAEAILPKTRGRNAY